MTARFSWNQQDTGGHRPPLQFDQPGTVPELLLLDSELVQHRQQQVRHRRVRSDTNVTPAFDLAGSAADQKYRQRIMVVLVAVAQRAPVQYQRMIEQCAVTVRRLLELIEEVGQRIDVVL